ncbi:MAG: DNA polymerase III subunit gamma/tau [Holosporaceae bacterium]|jgi:DNA polymerase-3 subunit gamma/tau|nr:DNA polymerase III subunit gamma/tau [Holosporaceae bacterium]
MGVYVPLATKYRPKKFADVIGQDMSVRIIVNGMRKDRLGAALLFSGTRGVGKTTLARILAKAFRCENRGSDPEPCSKCDSCREFAGGGQMDVIEIDAASNTGVEDVREIIESCQYRPAQGNFKIFIIDEVHMLSRSAFNALLKTLEEPPAHVKFLLATTETHKIPETILSRVLKFDLQRVNVGLIAQYLSSICHRENIVADAGTLSLMARAGNGSIRDSLSILDQAINLAKNNELTASDLKDMLNVVDDAAVVELLEMILQTSVKSAITKYRRLLDGSVSGIGVAKMLLNYVYVLICLKTNLEPMENSMAEEISVKLQLLADGVSLPALSRIWQMLLKGLEEANIGDNPEIVMEMILVRIAYASGLPDLHEIISSSTVAAGAISVNNAASKKETGSLLDDAVRMFPGAVVK